MSDNGKRLDIDVDYLRRQLEALLAIPSPTGYTDNVVRYVCGEIESLGLDYELTRRGAIRARLPGAQAAGARAIVSHLDTLGAQVKDLRPDGRLGLVPIGTWSARFAEGARSTIFSAKGTYRGTILPPKASGHAWGDAVDTAPIGWEHLQLRVDARSGDGAELAQLGIEVGDIVAIDPQPEFMDNGTSAPGQNSAEFGVTVSMADQTGPFDYHLTRKLVELCKEHDIRYQKDVFRFYRSDSASAVEAGADVRTALVTFGVDASHGYERIHMHALRSIAELLTAYALSRVAITRDETPMSDLDGFTRQPMRPADQRLRPE